MLDVSTLTEAESSEVRVNGCVVTRVWYGEAHGVEITYRTQDLDATFWVSPIWTMREKGVALVNSHGIMVKNERRDR